MAKPTTATVVGIAWYRPEDWERALQLFPDRDDMHDSHAGWLAEAHRAERAVVAGGHRVKRVLVDPAELASWCLIRGLAPNAHARAEFVTDKLRREGQRQR